MLNNKPNFGAGSTTTVTSTETKAQREEIGAIWKRLSKNGNHEFMAIKISKSKLKELLDKAGETDDSVSLVAFVNKSQNGDTKRPSFRIFEEEKKNGSVG